MDTIPTNMMDCPALACYRAETISTYLHACRKYNLVSPDTFQRLLNNILDKHPDAVEEKVGEYFYFALGSALASLGEWNRITFLQLEHEARVQGLLGPSEEHDMTRLQLMLRLMAEKKRHEEEEREEDECDECDFGTYECCCDEKVVLTRNGGVRMRF